MDSDLKNGDSDLKNEEMTEGQEMSEDSDLGSEKELTEEDVLFFSTRPKSKLFQ